MRTIIILCLLCAVAFAGDLRTPSPQTDAGLYDYLLHVRDNHNNLRVQTTNPDGNTAGEVGDIVLFNDSGTYYLEVCVDADNDTWVGVVLTDTP